MPFEYSFEEIKRFDVINCTAFLSSTCDVRIRIDKLSKDDVRDLRQIIEDFCE